MSENDDEASEEALETREEHLLEALRALEALEPGAETSVVEAAMERVAGELERLLSDLLPLCDPQRTGAWWCDGFAALELEQVSPTLYRFSGMTWWLEGEDPGGLAPFALECEFPRATEGEEALAGAACLRLRFGRRLPNGDIQKPDPAASDEAEAPRPEADADWFLAVELS